MNISVPQMGWTFAGFLAIAIVLFLLYLSGTDNKVKGNVLVSVMVIVAITLICIGAYKLVGG